MCGRFTQMMSWSELASLLTLPVELSFQPAPVYNVAPTSEVAVLREGGPGLVLTGMHWGVRPSWSRSLVINARAERYLEGSWWSRGWLRCLIPADGFFEWRRVEGKRTSEPSFVRGPGGTPLALGGLYRRAKEGAREEVVILTTDANDLVRPLHDRMPLVVPWTAAPAWSDAATGAPALAKLVQPAPAGALEAYRVSTRVNSVKNDDRALLDPLDA